MNLDDRIVDVIEEGFDVSVRISAIEMITVRLVSRFAAINTVLGQLINDIFNVNAFKNEAHADKISHDKAMDNMRESFR